MIPVHHVLEIPGGGLWHVASHRERRQRRGRKARALTPAILAARSGLSGFDGLPTICLVGDRAEPLQVEEWESFVVPDGAPVVFLSRPMGGAGRASGGSGTGKAIGAAVGAIALAVLAPYAIGAIGAAGAGFLGSVGALTTAGQIASAVLVAGGGMLLSHFMAPKAGGKSETGQASQSIYNVSSQGNRPRPQQTVPVGYGRCIHPLDYAAPAFSLFNANNQEEWNLFTLGCGDYSVEELRIGDTTVWTSGGGVVSGYTGLTVELLPPEVACTIFPTNVVPNTDVSSVTVPTNGANTAEQVVNAAGTEATMIYVALAWSRSYSTYSWKGQSGNQAATTIVSVDYAEINDAGSQIGGWTTVSQTFSLLSLNGYRHTMSVPVETGRYKIRVRASGLGETNELGLIGVSAAITHDQPGLDHYRIAVKRTAGADQQGLNGTWVSIQTRKVGVWNGSAFVAAPTRNPVWAALDIWSDPDYGASQPLSNVDLATMVSLATFADQQGFYFDHWFTSQMDLDEALRTCLRVMLAFPVYMMDKLSATYDGERSAPSMLFTDGEIVRGSMQVKSQLYRGDFADGVILEYLDESTWRAADARSGSGFNNPGRIQIPGVTDRDQATWLARRHAAETNYRRVEASWEVEGEARLLHIGDMVRVASSEPQAYAETLIAVSYNAGTRIITVDRAPIWNDALTDHWLQVRGRNGRPLLPIRCVKNNAAPLELVLNGTDVTAAEDAAGVTLAATIDRAALEDPCTIGFSPGSVRSFDVLLKEIRRNGPMRFTLSGVVDNPLVYDADSGDVSPLPTLPPIVINTVPVILRLDARMFQNGANCMLSASWRGHPGAVKYLAEVSYDDKASWVRITSTLTQPTFSIFVQPADLYLRVAGVTSSGIQGAWAETAKITAPTILISGDVFNLSVGIDNIVGDLYEKILGEGEGSLTAAQVIADKAFSAAEQARLAMSPNPSDNARVIDPLLKSVRADIDSMAKIVSYILGRMESLRGGLIEAGFEEESAEGKARMFGFSAVEKRITDVSASLDALAGTVTLYAATAISGDFADVLEEFTAVRLELNALIGSLTAYVTRGEFSTETTKITALESSMLAAEAAIIDRATVATVSGQSARIDTAEQTISAIQGVLTQVTSANVQFTDLQQMQGTMNSLLGLLARLHGEHVTQLSVARNNLSAFQEVTGEAVTKQVTELASVSATSLARFNQLNQTIAGVNTALSSQITSLSATITNPVTGLSSAHAQIAEERTVRATALTAEATARLALKAELEGDISAVVATESTARVSADNALAASISAVTATVNGISAGVVTASFASATPSGYTAAYDVRLNAGNTFGGMTFLVRGDGTSAVKFRAADFIIDDGTAVSPFYVSGGIVYINEARIKRGAITRTYLANGSASSSYPSQSVTFTAGDEIIIQGFTATDGTSGSTWGITKDGIGIGAWYHTEGLMKFARWVADYNGSATFGLTSTQSNAGTMSMLIFQHQR